MTDDNRLLTTRYLAPLVTLLVFGVYLHTLKPLLAMGDGGELLSAGYTLGLAHSPSFPLFTLLLKLALKAPLGQIAFRGNCLSALWGGLSVTLLFLLLRNYARLSIALAGGLIFAWLPASWIQASHAEVYTLAFGLVILLLLIYEECPDPKKFLTAFLVWGLLGANHSLMAVSLVVLFIMTMSRLRKTKRVIMALTLLILALGVYCYLPIRSVQGPPIDWGKPQNVPSFIEAVTRKSTAGTFFFFSKKTVLPRLKALALIFYRQFNWLLFPALIGLFFFPAKTRLIFFSVIMINILTEFSHRYFSPYHPDILAYYGISNIILVCGLTLFLHKTVCFLKKRPRHRLAAPRPGYLLSGLVFCVPLVLLALNYPAMNQRANKWAYYFGLDLMNSLPRRSVLAASEIDVAFPLAYLKIVENRRSDLIVKEGNIFPPRITSRELLALKRGGTPVAVSFVESLRADYLPPRSRLVPDGLVYRVEYERSGPAPFALWSRLHLSARPNPGSDFLASWLIADYYLLAGENAFYQNKPARALSLWAKAAGISGADKELRNLLGLLYASRNYPDRAYREFQAALALDPGYVNAYTNLGNWYLGKQEPRLAVSCFRQALAISSDDLDSLNNLGTLYLKSDNTAAAGVALLEKCLALNSNFLNAYYNLGNYYFTKSDWQKALTNFEQIIRRDPVNIKALNALAGVYLRTGQKRKAEFYYLEALNQDAGYPLTLYNLINLYEDSGQMDKARSLARRLSQLSGLPKKYGWLNNWAQDKLLKLKP